MTQAILRSIVSGTTKDYLIEGLLSVNERKSQQSPALPIPTLADDKAALTATMGQTRSFTLSFIIVDRDDDYTNSTGSPGSSPYSIKDQRKWIMDTVFTRGGSHFFIDEQGVSMKGRIQDVEFTKVGDDPYSDSATVTFARGIPFG
jgi:hypothetical protein